MSSAAIRVIFLAALSFIALPVLADDDEEDEHSGHQPAVAEEKSAANPAPNPHLRLKEIEDLMSRIQASSDVAKRQEMLTEHLNAMRENMRLIRSHHTASTMKQRGDGDGAHSAHQASDAETGKGGMMGKKKGMMMGMMGMHKKVERRLELLERMLQQLIEHEAAERELEAQ